MIKPLLHIFMSLLFTLILVPVKAEKVTISGRQLLVNEKQYIIKGICYKPVPKGKNTEDFSSLGHDLKLMNEAGINTIRVYSPIPDRVILDRIHEAGIKIIISIGYNQEGKFDILSGSFINYIRKFKNHEAILLWELGNEFNYHPEWFNGDIKNWYSALNNAAQLIHEIDPHHPVASAHGELPDSLALSSCSEIDIWGINVYRWDNPEGIFKEWSAISTKPMYLSEAGADSYMTVSNHGYEKGVNEKAQADATKNILDDIFRHSNICSGVAIFAFVDEWWKAGDFNSQDPGGWAPNSSAVPYDGTANEEYWGIVDIDRKKKLSFDVVKAKFNSIPEE